MKLGWKPQYDVSRHDHRLRSRLSRNCDEWHDKGCSVAPFYSYSVVGLMTP
jgi:hypothetical protein